MDAHQLKAVVLDHRPCAFGELKPASWKINTPVAHELIGACKKLTGIGMIGAVGMKQWGAEFSVGKHDVHIIRHLNWINAMIAVRWGKLVFTARCETMPQL